MGSKRDNGLQRISQHTNTGSKHSIQMANGNSEDRMSISSKPGNTSRHERLGSVILDFVRGPTSLFILTEKNPIRRLSKHIVEHKAFEYFILTNIVANCVVLAMNKPLPGEDKLDISKKLDTAEIYFVTIFCIEAVLKIVATGFVLHPGSYLRNGWNILDFVVVVVGIVSLPQVKVSSNVDVKALRAVRVLRPIKLISGVPSLQVVMKSIGRAMVPLLQIALLVLFVIVIYAIIGIEFLRDQFHSTCVNDKTNETEANPEPCDPPPHNGVRIFFKGRSCPTGWTCQRNRWEGPDNGISTFDNIGLSMLTVFQCVTMEGWTTIMYNTFMAIDERGFLYSIYFVSLIVIGSFFMLNLVLGVLSGEFAKERERVETRREFFKVRRQQQLDRQVAGYIEWMSKADEIRLREESRNESMVNVSESDTQASVVGGELSSQANGERFNQPNRKTCHERFSIQQARFKLFIRKCVKSQWFYWLVLICVFLNTISLATEHYNQPNWLSDFQHYAETVFLVIFSFEMVLKMYSLGFEVYFSSSFNIFDCVVVLAGIIETVINEILPGDFNLGLSVLRCVRLLRVFKVTRHWKSMRNLATSLVSSIKSIISLIFLLFLFILISALLGMQIFGGKFTTPTETPRTNFDNFPNAMLTVFQILTGEDWNGVMRQGIMAFNGPHNPWGLVVSLYFVLLVIIGNYTLLNVFLAIAVDNLANAQILTRDEEEEEKEKVRKRSENREKFAPPPEPEVKKQSKWNKTKSIPVMLAIKNFGREKTNNDQLDYDGIAPLGNRRTERRFSEALGKKIEAFRREENQAVTSRAIPETEGTDGVFGDEDGRQSQKRRVRERRGGRRRTTSSNDGRDAEDDDEDEDNPKITAKNFMKVLRGGRLGNRRRRGKKTAPIIRTRTLFIFGPDNRFRRLCHSLVNLAHFDTAMLVVIGLSSITIAAEDPLWDKNPRNKYLWYFDIVFTVIFALEVIVKVIDMGFILHKGAYVRDWWNVIDALVVICNIASLILTKISPSGPAGTAIKTLRVVRVLRPFKSVHKIKKLQAVFRCMWFSVKNVANILMITGFFLLIFAVIGVQLFNGKFFYCTDNSKLEEKDCKGEYFTFDYNKDGIPINPTNPKVNKRLWERRVLNFDNVGEAMLTLYTSSTGEGWPTAMHRTMDTTEKNKGPIQDYNTVYAIYYVSFVVVFSFFFLNIFVALIILTFQDLGEKEISNCELDRNQRDCIHFALSAKPAQLYMPSNEHSFQYKVWVVTSSKPFDAFIMFLIALNSVVLMMQYHGQSKLYENVCMYLNIAFTALFTFEALVKIIALRTKYFRDFWNLFDFVIVLGGLLDMAFTTYAKVTEDDNQYLPFDPTMFRLFRAARLIKLLRQGYTIRILLWTFLRSFKALPYVTLLITLQFFMYAVIGMQLFGKIAFTEGSQITVHNNFRDIFQALQVLFRSATGEDWHLIMTSCFTGAKCAKEANMRADAQCGSTPVAIIYFCTFIFLCMFLMLNLFVAVIMDNFEYLTRDESILGPHHLDEFVRVWSEYDHAATGFIHHKEVYKMMCSMSPPVGFGKKCPKIVGYKRLIKMNMPLDENNKVTFSTTLFALIRISLNIKLSGNMNANDTELRKLIKRLWPNSTSPKVLDKLIPKQSVLSSQQMTIGKIYCAKLIHENYKYSKKKAESGYERGLLRKIVGSIRNKTNRHSANLSATDGGYDSNYLSPRPRSRTLDVADTTVESVSADLHNEGLGNHSKQGNSVARSNSWSSQQPNGDIEMKEIKPTLRETLNPSSSPSIPLRNGRTGKADVGSNGPVVPIVYLTASPKPRIRRHTNVDHSTLDNVNNAQPISNGDEPQAQSPAKSRDDEYYDDMITRINQQLVQAVEKGQSPYCIYGLEGDDESEWC